MQEPSFKIGDRVMLYKNDSNSRFWNSSGDMDHWVGTIQVISGIGQWAQEPTAFFEGGGPRGGHDETQINYWTWTGNMFRLIGEKKILKLKLKSQI